MLTTLDTESLSGEVWLTADLHLGHESILKYGRPWKDIDKHDNTLIKMACELVKPEDTYIIVGDLTTKGPGYINYIRGVVNKLPGNKVLVFGNHDRLKPSKYIDIGFACAATSLILPGGILVCHDPAWATVWPKDKPVLCGRIHELFKVIGNVVNVGVDVHDYRPIRLADALDMIESERGDEDWDQISRDRHKIDNVQDRELDPTGERDTS